MAAANQRPQQTGMTSEKLRETPGAKAAKPAPRRQKTAKIRMVADRADISVAGLYYYVHSKEELLYLIQYHVFDGLVRRFESDSEQMLAEGGEAARPEARLLRFIHNHLDHFLADMDSLTVCTRELRRLNGDYLQEVEALQRAYFSQAFEIFQELCSTQDGNQMDPRTATLAMFGAINWVSTWYNPASDKSAGELARELVKLYLHGVNATDREAADRILETQLEAVSARKDRGRK
jgi:AcrR family transcriptional regulator